mmetsp:Transcript_22799/g.24250  ORF Transcript_22799/g.24250 Transcript_22799/m.24250 type:complete len:85 (-) Transcript_22799:156-410(-)
MVGGGGGGWITVDEFGLVGGGGNGGIRSNRITSMMAWRVRFCSMIGCDVGVSHHTPLHLSKRIEEDKTIYNTHPFAYSSNEDVI